MPMPMPMLMPLLMLMWMQWKTQTQALTQRKEQIGFPLFCIGGLVHPIVLLHA
jgi:hypothetical protein